MFVNITQKYALEQNKMIIDKYRYGTIKYCDCLDEEHGLPSLADKSFDLGYVDPPWGVNIDKTLKIGRTYCGGRTLKATNKDIYKDSFRPEWNLEWFNNLNRVCNNIILVIGETVKYWWIRNTDPVGDLTIHWLNGHSRSKISRWNKKSTYLFYGKFKNKLYSNVLLDNVMKWGFVTKEKWDHPSPKGTEIILKILKQLKPKSLIDPFIGSGSYGQACEILKIPWLGYEINETYQNDAKKRMSSVNTGKSGIKYWLEPK